MSIADRLAELELELDEEERDVLTAELARIDFTPGLSEAKQHAFGLDSTRCDIADTAAVQRSLAAILPGYDVESVAAHDWLADEFARGTWAIHRPGWYEHHHAAMQEPEGSIVLAGADVANGWAGFIDGAIETGIRAARVTQSLAD